MTKEKIKVTGIICPKCEEFIWSRHRHDFYPCMCGYCAVDGGRDYLKMNFGRNGEKSQVPPEIVEREVDLDEPQYNREIPF